MPEVDTHNGANLLLGRGEVYLDRLTSAGLRTGEFLLGDCPAFDIGGSSESRDAYSSVVAASVLLRSVIVRVGAEVTIRIRELRREGLRNFLMGELATLAQTASGPIVDETFNVKLNHWYQVGAQLAANAVGKRSITAVTVTGPGGTPTYALDSHYKLDLVRGRIGIISPQPVTTPIIEGASVLVDYTASAITTGDIVQILKASQFEFFVRFVPRPATGPQWECELWRVGMGPGLVLSLISDDYAEFSIKGKIYDDSANHPVEPYGRLIRVG